MKKFELTVLTYAAGAMNCFSAIVCELLLPPPLNIGGLNVQDSGYFVGTFLGAISDWW